MCRSNRTPCSGFFVFIVFAVRIIATYVSTRRLAFDISADLACVLHYHFFYLLYACRNVSNYRTEQQALAKAIRT